MDAGFIAVVLGGLRRGGRGKWRILGVGGCGGYCHFFLLVAVVIDPFLYVRHQLCLAFCFENMSFNLRFAVSMDRGFEFSLSVKARLDYEVSGTGREEERGKES